MMSPLLVKALIRFSQEGVCLDQLQNLADVFIVYGAQQAGTPKPGIGRGVGMAIGLWALVVFQSICQHQVCRIQLQLTVAHHSSFSDLWLLVYLLEPL